MASPRQLDDGSAQWQCAESALARLHGLARSELSRGRFYQRLVTEIAAALPQGGVAVWSPSEEGAELLAEAEILQTGAGGTFADRQRVARQLLRGEALGDEQRTWRPVPAVGGDDVAAVLELLPATHFGGAPAEWDDLADALAVVAGDFEAFSALRRITATKQLDKFAVDLLRRLYAAPDLQSVGYVATNEGRRALACERLSVVLRHGKRWRTLAASGVDHVEPRSTFADRMERLAGRIAAWGEPLTVGEAPGAAATPELPPPLADDLAAYFDHSHARALAAVPLAYPPLAENDAAAVARRKPAAGGMDAVLVAEWFQSAGPAGAAAQLAELSELCAPAFARGAALDGPVARRIVGRALQRSGERHAGLPRWAWITLAVAAIVAALLLVSTEFEVEAPATLLPAVRHEIFATASGRVAEVRVTHGQQVAAGDVLAVLEDRDLDLRAEQIAGELATVNRRIEALAVARTERTVREQADRDALPPGAEQQQLLQKRASLERQQALLARRREELTLRSPGAGQVLTRDVESLLASRPVERGQALLTIADPTGPWELTADVEQRDIGHVAAAGSANDHPLPVRFRLAGDVDRVRTGTVAAIDAAATLDVEDLSAPAPPVQVHVAVGQDQLESPRAGTAATVRIACGRHSLAYAWFHDLAATIYRWWVF